VRACLTMREELEKLNQLRISRGQNALKIGMGLNVGPVIAGNIGSVEKMEYTVIGDTVNLASRMESMTKEYGTDLLIPKTIYDRLKDRFIFEKCKDAKVKGKSSAIEIYKVRGYIDEAGNGIVIETPYSSYASEKSDKAVHDDEPAVAEKITAVAQNYFVEMYGEVMGPFTPEEFKNGIASAEFPSDARFSVSKTGTLRDIKEFGQMTLSVGEDAQFIEIPEETLLVQDVPAPVQKIFSDEPALFAPARVVTPPPFRHKIAEGVVTEEISVDTEVKTEVVTEVASGVVQVSEIEAVPQFVTEPAIIPDFTPPDAPGLLTQSSVVQSVDAPIVFTEEGVVPDTAPTFSPPDAPPAPSAESDNASTTGPVIAEEIAPPAFPSADVVSEGAPAAEIEMPSLEDKPAA
jgi:hypothetical protein